MQGAGEMRNRVLSILFKELTRAINNNALLLIGLFLVLNSLKLYFVEQLIISSQPSFSFYSILSARFIFYFIVNSTIILTLFRFRNPIFVILFYFLQAIYLFTHLTFSLYFDTLFHGLQFLKEFSEGAGLLRYSAVPLHIQQTVLLIDFLCILFIVYGYSGLQLFLTAHKKIIATFQKLFIISLLGALLFSYKIYKINNDEHEFIERFGLFSNDISDLIFPKSEEAVIKDFIYGKPLIVKNKTHGKFYNIICIQIESLDAGIVNYRYKGRYITPFLHKLSSQCIYYPYLLTFRRVGGTSDVEFSMLNSVGPLTSQPVFTLKTYRFPNSLIKRLAGNNFESVAFHNNVGSFFNRDVNFLKMGFNDFYDIHRMNLAEKGWGAPDADLLNFVKEKLKSQKTPFFYYIITMSSHEPFTNAKLYYKNELYNDIDKEIIRNYFTSLTYVDNCLEDFVNYLRNNIKDTYIFIYGDHQSELGKESLFKNSYAPLFIITPDDKKYIEHHKIICSYDLSPTILYASGIDFAIKTNGINLLDLGLKEGSIRYAEISLFNGFKEQDKLDYNVQRNNTIALPLLVVHGGGLIKGISYTNSLQALENSVARGFNFIELDVEWTNDRQLVFLHDWEGTVERLFHVQQKTYSLKEFNGFTMVKNLKQLNFNELKNWLIPHSAVFIITDIKRDNVDALTYISQHYPGIKAQLIPQIYDFKEYDTVKSLGYKNIILTLYRSNYTDEEIMEFVQNHPVTAMTMSKERAMTDLPQRLNSAGVFVYAYTVNQIDEMERLTDKGVDGFYTDILDR